MLIVFDSTVKKLMVAGLAIVTATLYIAISARNFLAAHFSGKEDRHALELAVKLSPGNADYHDRLGMDLFENQELQRAFEQFRLATYLNSHNAHYWLNLGKADLVLNHNKQGAALDRALLADPRNPAVAWEAANHFLVQGEVKRALEEFRVVMEGAPNQVYPSLQLCLHLASVQTILADALPRTPLAYLALVDLLTSQKDTAGAQTTWDALVELRQPVDTGRALQYISYLIVQHEVGQARTAWNEIIQLNGLSSYLTGHDNLIVNPSFDADILNGGFDWQYRHRPNVELTIDPSDFRAGRRSLVVSFDGPGISDAGIFQLIPVEPDTTYDFSAYFKSDNIDGAGGPRLALDDAYTSTSYLQSDDLKNSDVWRQVSGQFKTQPDTQLIVLRLMRVPQNSPIRGKLWIDNFQLSEKQP